MYSITGVITLVLTVVARLTFAEQTAPLRCYICVTDYEDNTQNPGCSISSPNVIVRACAVQHGYDRCISYRARNTNTGNTVFRRHCATREMCEYQCLFSHHTNCQTTCCRGNLCNDVNFEGYEGTSEKPEISSTTKVPVITQNPNTTPGSDSTKSSQSTRNPTVTKTTTNAPVTTHKVSTTEEPLIGGPPITSIMDCHDYREQCSEYAANPGYCQYTREFMLLNCPWSCQFCVVGVTTKASTKSPTHSTSSTTTTSTKDVKTTYKSGNGGIGGPSTGCVDAREECAYFANFDGYCQYHYGFMLTHCSKSCDFCDDVQLPKSPVKKATTAKLPITTSEPSEQFQQGPTPFGPGGEGERELLKTSEQFQQKPTPFGPGGEDYENSRCIDLRENCTHYATKYDDYCNYNKDFMKIYCPFSCGFCGTTVPNGAFPYPPIIHQHQMSDNEFPTPPSKKDARWLTSFCSECQNGFQECIPKCILLLKDGIYEPTSNDVCIKILGKPNEILLC